jgi:hypothetical protein
MQTWLNYGSVYPKIWTAWQLLEEILNFNICVTVLGMHGKFQLLIKISHAEFQWNVWMDVWNSPFIALCKLGFMMNYYSQKSVLRNSFQWKCPTPNFSICEKVYVIHREVHWRPYIIQGLLLICVSENWKTFTESIPCQILV